MTDATTQVSVGASTLSTNSQTVDQQVDSSSGSGADKASTKSKLKKLTRSATSGGHGLSIPILSNPINAFKLLTGETVELLEWDIPELDLSIPFSKLVLARSGRRRSLPKSEVTLVRSWTSHLGFDTRGISQTGNFLDGLYFGDFSERFHW